METFPSGLPKSVADAEELARFLTSSSQFNAKMAKPSAFLPSYKDHETSTSRHGSEPRDSLWTLGETEVAGQRTIHGAAICNVGHIRSLHLEVEAAEPPPRHAAIKGWPWDEVDPELLKAKHKEIAGLIASKAVLVIR